MSKQHRDRGSRARRLALRERRGDVWAVQVETVDGPRIFAVRGRGQRDALAHGLAELDPDLWNSAHLLSYVPLV
jgi:hypothetical protein